MNTNSEEGKCSIIIIHLQYCYKNTYVQYKEETIGLRLAGYNLCQIFNRVHFL